MKTKNVRTTLAALLSAALLSAPTTLWGQASQHGVRVVSQNDVKKVNATDITADGELVGASDNSTVTVTAADKTTETTPKVARVTVRKVTDVAANTVTISGSNAVSYGASTTLTLTADPTYADGAVSWRYVVQSDNSSNGKVEFSSQTAVSASNGQATVSVKGTGAGKVNVYAKVGNVESAAYTVTINKVAATKTDPTTKSGLTYTGSALALANAGSSSHGSFSYSTTQSGTYSSSVPTGTAAGSSYAVYWKFTGDANHNDATGSLTGITISAKTVSSPTITLSPTSYTYDGAAKTPIVTVKDGSTTIPASEYTVGYSNNTNAGTATVTITDKTGGNYTVSGSTTFTINKAAASLTCSTDALSFTASNKKDATVTKTGVSASGGSVSVSSSNTDYCTVSYASGTITVKRVSEAEWTATITVSVTADGNHTWADSNKKTFTVSAAGCFRLLSEATTSDHGKVVCAAGHLHDAKTAVPSGCTAVGILGRVTSTGHGLILALQDATDQDWNTINGWNSVTTYAGTTLKVLLDNTARGSLTSYTALGSTNVSNWAVAQKADYIAIFTNLGSTRGRKGITYDGNVNAYITGAGGTGMPTDFPRPQYWSATEEDNGLSWAFSDEWFTGSKTYSLRVRPVLAF